MNDEDRAKAHDDVNEAMMKGFNRLYVEQIAGVTGLPLRLLSDNEPSTISASKEAHKLWKFRIYPVVKKNVARISDLLYEDVVNSYLKPRTFVVDIHYLRRLLRMLMKNNIRYVKVPGQPLYEGYDERDQKVLDLYVAPSLWMDDNVFYFID